MELKKDGRFFETKPEGVKILQITADGTGVVYGIGNDQRVYNWHHSFELRGMWVLHTVVSIDEKKAIDKALKKERGGKE